jgi:penicillin-binding protein 1A
VALEQDLSLLDVEVDEPYEYFQNGTFWAPRNHTRTFAGPMTLARALSFSNNVVTIKTALKSGLEHIVEMSKRAGISAGLQPYPSLALGCVNATVLESAGAFNLFANHGIYVEPHYLRWIKNKSGEKIYKAKVAKRRVLSWKIASQIGQVLTFSIRRLQAAIGDRWFGGEALGKTGTTNDSRTCWFCGSTPDYTTAIYIGSDDNSTLGEQVYASKVAFPIWFYFHQTSFLKPAKFAYDPLLKPVLTNWKTGEIVEKKNNSGENIVTLLI